MTAPLSAFMPLVRAYAPAVPVPVAEQMLRLAAREFCKDTRCWREVLVIPVAANPFTIGPAYSTVVAIQKASFGGVDLKKGVFEDLPLAMLDDVGLPDTLYQISPDEFCVYPFEAGDLTVSVYLTLQEGPRFGSDGAGSTHQANQSVVPDFLFAEHAMSIAHGALARILVLPGQEYTDGAAAGMHGAAFQQAKAALFGANIRGKQRAPIRTKSRWM